VLNHACALLGRHDSGPEVVRQDPIYTVAFPEIATDDMRWIQLIREQHDPQFATVDPHFTMVFGIRDLSEGVYLNHVAGVARLSREIYFTCRYAMVGADDADDTAYVFLVPDEGNASIALLHDQLYRGPFKPFLRLESPYIPHISIASMKDFTLAKELCDELNGRQVSFEGRTSALTAGVLRDGRFDCCATYGLDA
jgi:2'-5' RNA ligase superfamily